MSRTFFYMNVRIYIIMMLYQSNLQQELLEAQQTIIQLQKRIDKMTPKVMPDEDVFWHVTSGGVLSNTAANSDDLKMVRKFRQWNVDFAKKNIKPYVNPQVYGETLNQMTRGLNERIAELEAKQHDEPKRPTNGQLRLLQESPKPKLNKVEQLAFISN